MSRKSPQPRLVVEEKDVAWIVQPLCKETIDVNDDVDQSVFVAPEVKIGIHR